MEITNLQEALCSSTIKFQPGDYFTTSSGLKFVVVSENNLMACYSNGYSKDVSPKKKLVSKEEFLEFIANYPRSLVINTFNACDPPAISYNDYSLGAWPKSIVAMTYEYDDDPKGYFYCPEEKRTYRITTNYKELYEDAAKHQNDVPKSNYISIVPYYSDEGHSRLKEYLDSTKLKPINFNKLNTKETKS